MQPWSIISAVVGIIALMLSMFIHFNSSINQKIEDKVNDPSFIKKVADQARLPFVIFDDKESVLINTGAMVYIENIEIKKDKDKNILEIIVSPNKFMAVPPDLESIDDKNIGFETPKRGKKYDLIYKVVRLASTLDSAWDAAGDQDSRPHRRFRLQLIVTPE